jgi:two-component system, chemotaxis family, chemotaxis protein CheY
MWKVLIVDDSIISRNTMENIFRELKFKIVGKAVNGAEAVDLYKKTKPDLVLMDIIMPEMNGIDALKNIIRMDSEANIIMATSHNEELMVMDAIYAGARGYTLKPIDKDHLVNEVERVLSELED